MEPQRKPHISQPVFIQDRKPDSCFLPTSEMNTYTCSYAKAALQCCDTVDSKCRDFIPVIHLNKGGL